MQIGGESWQRQQEAVQALNLQAHHNAASHSDEFVKEALVLHDKIRVLVVDLLAFEVGQLQRSCCFAGPAEFWII